MSEFPTLKPILTFTGAIEPPRSIGPLSSGGVQAYVNIRSSTMVSEPGAPSVVNAKGVMGGDWIHADPDGKHLRLDVRSVLETDDGAFITLLYKGLITVNEALQKCFSRAPDAKSTDFGDIFIHVSFQTGAPKYKWLEDAVFVGSGRALAELETTVVEYKICQVEHN